MESAEERLVLAMLAGTPLHQVLSAVVSTVGIFPESAMQPLSVWPVQRPLKKHWNG